MSLSYDSVCNQPKVKVDSMTNDIQAVSAHSVSYKKRIRKNRATSFYNFDIVSPNVSVSQFNIKRYTVYSRFEVRK